MTPQDTLTAERADRTNDPDLAGGADAQGSGSTAATVDPGVLAERILAGGEISRGEALALLATPDADVLGLVRAGGRLRRHWFGNSVKLNYLVNLKSGMCPEDCGYCSQRLGSEAEVLTYSWLSKDKAVEVARAGMEAGAKRVCLVSSGRGPSNRDIDRVADIIGGLKEEDPEIEVCACLGLLKDGQAERLAAAGGDAYNHNLNTAESNYADICSTHSYADRADTVDKAKDAGLSPCSGLIAGMGETPEQLVEVVFALRGLDSDSVPVNFLMPFEGTPLEGTHRLTPLDCLRILAMVRFVHPDKEVRIAGGREDNLRSLQPLGLEVANSIFLGDYLTSEGQAGAADLQMIADAGFVPVGAEDDPAYVAPQVGRGAPVVRRRGAGTDVAPNA
ncbi:biotin synthase [Raineyella antarctica]|uniref:Biotin synthase n=1 Tax=Raineyella antarctica TaxID=1577474 RepID=A0A1G6HW22_9ACTN|nr:biotin synthase BioB [Raineyella antarctica]SDB98462.1 biotin synthase [Raineyella antarctica]